MMTKNRTVAKSQGKRIRKKDGVSRSAWCTKYMLAHPKLTNREVRDACMEHFGVSEISSSLASMARAKANEKREQRALVILDRQAAKKRGAAPKKPAKRSRAMSVRCVEKELTQIRRLLRRGTGIEQFQLLDRLTAAMNRLVELERSLTRPFAVH